MSDSGLLNRKGIAQWDEHRNSSRVFPVPPTALPDALDALRRFHETDPALYEWVAGGAPSLTHDEHFARFGEHYKATRSRKVSATTA